MKKVVFITGTGHCGSTLLDLILSSHSRCFGLGEIHKLKSSPLFFNDKVPFCNIHGEHDSFWTDAVRADLLSKVRKNSKLNKYIDKYALQAGQLSERYSRKKVYQYLFELTQCPILIDSSKHPKWIEASVLGLKRAAGIEPYLIYLSRDGRAVINSLMRKYKDKQLEEVAYEWISQVEKINDFYAKFSGPKLQVRYEDLASQPEKVIPDICQWMEIDYEPTQLNFWEHEHHHIGGNAGTKSLLTKFQYNKMVSAGDKEKSYYKEHSLSIQLDERWKQELSVDQISGIEKIINPHNKKFTPHGN